MSVYPMRNGGPRSVNSETARRSLAAFRPGAKVSLVFVVSASPSEEDLARFESPAERLAALGRARAPTLKAIIEAVRRREDLKIVNDPAESGHVLVRGAARAFSDERTGLFNDIRDLPVEVYPNHITARAF